MNSDYGVFHSRLKQWLGALAASCLLFNSTLDTIWAYKRQIQTSELESVPANIACIIIGAILGAVSADIYGRKKTLLVATIFVIPHFASLNFVSANLSWINGLFINIGSGIAFTVVPLYISEIVDTNIRGTLMVLQLSVLTVKMLVIVIQFTIFPNFHLTPYTGIINNALLFIVTIFQAMTLGLLPETPHYLNWKKRYQEATRSLAFFTGDNQVKVTANASGELTNTQLTNESHSRRAKINEIIRIENRRSLAIIFSLTAIKWATGQYRNRSILFMTIPGHGGIGIWIVELIFSIYIMFFIDRVKQKLSLLLFILGSCIATLIALTPLTELNWPIISFFIFLPILGYLYFAAVEFVYVGEFFSMNVKAIASAAVISFEVLARNVIFPLIEQFSTEIMSTFCVSASLLCCAFFFVLIFFPKTNNVPCSNITIEIAAGEESASGNN